ncbi:MAG: HAMP domain-containing sensor histidine kinase [Anaerolineales bacterium]|jgi:signal transduction histidine kinase
MLKSLYWKLTLAFMLVAFTTAALVALFIRLTSANRLMQLVIEQQRSSLQQTLQSYYASNGSWVGVSQNWSQIQSLVLPTPAAPPQDHPPQDNHPPDGQDKRNFLGLADAQGTVIVPVDHNYPAGSSLPPDILRAGTPISVDGQQVGTILTANEPPGFNPQEAQFLQRTNEALIYAMLGALLVALAIGILLARTLTSPLQALTRAAQSITQGQLEQQVKVGASDEIGQLATAFNRMSQEVARVNQLRRQMTADIAHDLRTPLTVISGYVESMRDGDLKPTTERFALIYSEIERLQNLVGDLRMLSMADAGELSLNPQSISPKNLLERTSALFRNQAERQHVTIQVDAGDDLPNICVDEARMIQVLGNLISNALHYSSSDGTITLAAQPSGDRLEIRVEDMGIGIPADELPYIFNRFHRGDKSRHTETGETGLGLAIVKALVEAHGGSVLAESHPDEGTIIRLAFPIDQA